MRKLLFMSLCIITILASCNSNEYDECVFQPDVENPVTIDIERLEGQLLNANNKASLRTFLQANPIITNYFLQRNSYPDDSIMMEVLLKKFSNPYIDTLMQEVDQVFGDLSILERELSTAFGNLKYYYPEVQIPKIQTIVTGLDYDLFVSDSLIIIGLDYYLGPGARFRPVNMYQYILKRYAPDYIVPSIMLLNGISPTYNKTQVKDKTILADMISYGKSYYFAKHMLPCTPDSTIIWYTQNEIVGSTKNMDIIWSHFVENELLYETNHVVKKKYIDDRPKTYEIGDEAPGRIGTWLGWQIVRKYMDEHPQSSLPEMMQMESAQQLFKESRFKP